MYTVLIVEDDPLISSMYQKKLTAEGFQTLISFDGEFGLETAQTKHPDIILLDLGLPKLDGLQVLAQLRLDAWGKTVPIIILTNYEADDEKISRVLKDSPAYYLMKSATDLNDLVEKIKEILAIGTKH